MSTTKKVLTEEQKLKRREYHRKYEQTHKEQVKAWHKAYHDRKREAIRKAKESAQWIEERINRGKEEAEIKQLKSSKK